MKIAACCKPTPINVSQASSRCSQPEVATATGQLFHPGKKAQVLVLTKHRGGPAKTGGSFKRKEAAIRGVLPDLVRTGLSNLRAGLSDRRKLPNSRAQSSIETKVPTRASFPGASRCSESRLDKC